MTRALRVAVIISVALAAALLVVLATASSNTRFFERNYEILLWVTLGVAAMLFVLAAELVRRLVSRYRRGLFGTRLMARMAGAFVLMTVVPVALVFLVAVQFVGRSIESWFDVPLERALDSGLNLARASLDSQLADLLKKGRQMALELGDAPEGLQPAVLSRLRDQTGVQDALLVSGTGRIVSASTTRLTQLIPALPPAEALRQARLTRHFARVEGGEAGKPGEAGAAARALTLRVIVTVRADTQLLDDTRYLQLIQPVPGTLVDNAEAVQQGYRDFQELSLSRAGLKSIFRTTLTLTFLLTVFAAVAGAFLLAGWLTGPLSDLAAATRMVAEGDFRPLKDYAGRDELGVLTRSFNAMTRQLQEARSQVERNQRELERANAQLESVLSNLDAGVMVLDSDLRLTLANPGADRIIGSSLAEFLGEPLAALPRVGQLAPQVRAAFNEQVASGAASWQRQFALQRAAGASDVGTAVPSSAEQTLLARGSILPERRVGYVIVFDDISEVISAQRAVAWAEVARRLAHEITNPLTPIQLAAERLRHKLHDRLSPPDAELLDKNAQTIVNQVGALKMMVDEFRDYARLPAARLEPLNLNGLIEDVLRLYASTEAQGVMRCRLASDLPEVMGDATQLRQVIHNLLKNAREAADKRERPEVDVVTEAVELAPNARAVRLVVRDNGSGFTPAMLARAFEPYVTSKPRGTGLGLAIVRKIAEEHAARVDIGNWGDEDQQVRGAQISILFTKLAKSVDNPRFEGVAPRRDGGHG
ncbi:MAG: HAMP domain-containing protein [Burkholderiaceae bacterium]|nr:HAMP domain-containing protein [Burkholderiaceae bacterium]